MHKGKKLFWKNWIVLLLGFVVLLLPFLGFPARIMNWLNGIAGLAIVVISFLIGRILSYDYSLDDSARGMRPKRVQRPRAPMHRENQMPVEAKNEESPLPPSTEFSRAAPEITQPTPSNLE